LLAQFRCISTAVNGCRMQDGEIQDFVHHPEIAMVQGLSVGNRRQSVTLESLVGLSSLFLMSTLPRQEGA
jgi:hypothetical protein